MDQATDKPSPALRLIATGDSDEFFDLVLLHDESLVIIATQSREARDTLRQRLEKGEPVASLTAEPSELVFSYDEIPVSSIRQLEWQEGSNILWVEYSLSPGGKTADVGGWLEEAAVPQLLAALQQAGKPVDVVREEVVAARSLILLIALPISLFVALLAWGNGFGVPSSMAIAAGALVALAGLLWYSNREPSKVHVVTFR